MNPGQGARLARLPFVLVGLVVLSTAGCGGSGGGGGPRIPEMPEIPIVPADDHGDTRADATALRIAKSVPGVIEAGDDADFFQVEVAKAVELVVFTTGSLNTEGVLLDSEGAELARDDDSGKTGNFRIAYPATPGTYYVRVEGSGTNVGSYSVWAQRGEGLEEPVTPADVPQPTIDDHGDRPGNATVLLTGRSVTGAIETWDDIDVFRVDVTRPGTLIVHTMGSLDTVGALQDGGGTILAANDDGEQDTNFRIAHPVSPGTYYIAVTSFGDNVGDYAILAQFRMTTIADDHGDSFAGATILPTDRSVPGAIEAWDDIDVFRVDVTRPGTLIVHTTGGLDTVGVLYGGDSAQLATDDDGGQDRNFRMALPVTPGTYYVRIESYGLALGRYSVLAQLHVLTTDDHGDTLAGATLLPVGDSAAGVIEHGDDIDFFRVDVARSGTLIVHTTGGLDTVGVLYRSDGVQLAIDDDGGQDTNFRIAQRVTPGPYYIKVISFGEDVGSYAVVAELQVTTSTDDHGNTLADATALPTGQSVVGAIEHGDDVDVFRLDVARRGTLTVYTTGRLDTVGALRGSDGTQVATDDDTGTGRNFQIAHAVAAGTYYVEVASYGTNTGSYTVTAELTAVPPPADDHGDTPVDASVLQVGSAVAGAIETGNDIDVFRVDVAQTGTLTVSTTGSLDTAGMLRGSDGTQLVSDDDTGTGRNFEIVHAVTAGTYYVEVASYGTHTGSYTVAAHLNVPLPTDDHGDTRANATVLAVGSMVDGAIETENDIDVFRVDVAQTGTLTVSTTGSLDTAGMLQGSDGTQLASDDDTGTGRNFQIVHAVTAGAYYVEVASYGTHTGSYVVLATFLADHTDESDTPGAAIDIAGKDTVTGHIDSAGDVDYFQMTLSEPGVIELELNAPVGTEISALDETGRVLASGVVSGPLRSQGLGTRSTAPVVALTAATLGTVTLPPFVAEAAKKLLLRVIAPAGVRAAIGNPYVVAVSTVTVAALYIFSKRIDLEVDANGEIRQNLREFFECRRDDDRAVEGCEFEFKIIGELSVSTKGLIVPLTGRIESGVLYVSAPCEAEDGTAKASIEVTLNAGNTPITEKTGELTVRVRQSEACPTGLYGAVAVAIHSQCQGHAWGLSWNRSDEASAESEALRVCQRFRSSNLPGCGVIKNFGSAYGGNDRCAAVAYGERTSGNVKNCRFRVGTGSTESAAQSDALSECRSGGFNCSIQRSEEGRLSYCVQ